MIIKNKLTSLADWKEFISKKSAITELARKILVEHNFSTPQLEQIHIGTNAVFDLGNAILKIYATCEELPNARMDCRREFFLSNLLKNAPFRVPAILKTGSICDQYIIYYSFFNKIDGLHSILDSGYNFDAFTQNARMHDLHKVIQFINNLPIDPSVAEFYSKPLRNFNKDNDQYAQYLQRYYINHSFDPRIVHGDLSETNIYLDCEENIVVLDFEDWMYAPAFVEYPTICFDLLKSPSNIQSFFYTIPLNEFIEMLIAGILLHNESNIF